MWGISWVLWETQITKDFKTKQTKDGTRDIPMCILISPMILSIPHGTQDNPHGTHDIPTVLKISPTVLMTSPHSTHDIPPTVLNIPTVLSTPTVLHTHYTG